MISNAQWFLLIGGLLIFMGLTASRLRSLPVTSAIIYLAAGLLLGPSVLNMFHFTLVVVTLSILVHGTSVKPLMRIFWRKKD